MDRKGFRTAVYRAGLLLVSVLLLTLALAPWKQFYLAWFGLVPWLIVIAGAKSKKSTFFWSWITGTAFFSANMWWMAGITWPGFIALMIYCGIYWGFAALVIRGAGLLDRQRVSALAGVLGIAMVWTAFEWLRGTLLSGLPWLYLGHTQTPFLAICQIADITGAYGVTFWVAMFNAVVARGILLVGSLSSDQSDPYPSPPLEDQGKENARRFLQIAPAAGLLAAVTLAILLYGVYRMKQTPDCLSPGPMIAVVQTNYPQSNTGSKGATISERLQFHIDATIHAVDENAGKLDMTVWSETMMDPINREARLEQPEFEEVYLALSRLAAACHVALLTGAEFYGDWQDVTFEGKKLRWPQDRRNTAFFFDQSGHMNDSLGGRYDKIHLVPWGEFIPLKDSVPLLYRLFVELGPKYYSDYELNAGAPDQLTVFTLKSGDRSWRFVTPICFEDIEGELCAEMFRPGADGKKRADFLVNLTNDGWFQANENAQHLQAAIFRSIENRVWSARSVNTGISGFIDSEGQTHNLLPVRQSGTSVAQISIDNRLTFYTRYGDLFAEGCVWGSGALALAAWIGHMLRKRA